MWKTASVAVDGVDITGAMTKVTDDGSIVKWELTGLNPAKLVVTKKDDQKTQEVVLSDNENPDKPVVKSTGTDVFPDTCDHPDLGLSSDQLR